MPIRYKAQLNQGNANIGSERSVSANEDLLTCDEKAGVGEGRRKSVPSIIKEYIILQHQLLTNKTNDYGKLPTENRDE